MWGGRYPPSTQMPDATGSSELGHAGDNVPRCASPTIRCDNVLSRVSTHNSEGSVGAISNREMRPPLKVKRLASA